MMANSASTRDGICVFVIYVVIHIRGVEELRGDVVQQDHNVLSDGEPSPRERLKLEAVAEEHPILCFSHKVGEEEVEELDFAWVEERCREAGMVGDMAADDEVPVPRGPTCAAHAEADLHHGLPG